MNEERFTQSPPSAQRGHRGEIMEAQEENLSDAPKKVGNRLKFSGLKPGLLIDINSLLTDDGFKRITIICKRYETTSAGSA